LSKRGYYEAIIRSQLIKEELENQYKKEEYIRKMTCIKRVNTEDEVRFERRNNEISKSPDDVSLSICTIIKESLNFKFYFVLSFISLIILGVIPPLSGFYTGKVINSLNSKYETIRYDDGLKFSTIRFDHKKLRISLKKIDFKHTFFRKYFRGYIFLRKVIPRFL